jgi:uncharacterized protein YkwD
VRTSPRLGIAAACVLSLLAALVSTAPAVASRADCVPEAGWPAQNTSLALEVVQRVNAYRAARGLSQLQISQSLTNAAAWKASELAYDVGTAGPVAFDHFDYLTGRSPDARVQACGYGGGFGENIAVGQASPEAVMNAWIASDGHRRNLEYPGWVSIGVGAASGSAGTAWVQDFGVSIPDPVATPSATLLPPASTAPSVAVPLPSATVEASAAPPPADVQSAAAPAPGLQIMARPKARTRKRTARIRWAISGVAQQISCSLNGRTLRRCGTTGRTLRVRGGRQVFRVTVTGPTGTDSERISWRVLRRG